MHPDAACRGRVLVDLNADAALRCRMAKEVPVSSMEWFLSFTLLMIYITCLFTVCAMTFRKGHILLGIIGIFFPLLWLVGACLPAKEGSRYWVQEGIERQRMVEQMTR
jgi:hypothetical protein